MTRDEIIEHLQPAIDELVDRITALVPELVRAQLVETIGKLTGEVDDKPKRARKVVHRDPKPSKSSGRKPNSCKKCGAVGFTSATCGKTHNVSASPASTTTRSPSTTSSPATPPIKPPPPLSSSRTDRFAAIEAAARARRGE